MYRSHKISSTIGFNTVLPCSIRKAVPYLIVKAGDTCSVYNEDMTAIQNSLLTYLIDLITNKSKPNEAVSNLNALEQTLLLKCASMSIDTNNITCC
jgi:hypothetical protein